MTPGASIELAERLLARPFGAERPITADQTNESVVVDESIVVKWLRPPVPAPHPGVTLMRHLAGAGFHEMPSLLGIDERGGVVNAIVTSYLSGATDGWDWYVDDVEAWLGNTLAFDDLTLSASRMGTITARLHIALSDLRPSMVAVAPVADQALADLRLAVGRLDGLEWLDGAAVAAALQPLREASPVPGHRVHGDLHVGQFLRAGNVLLVTDFDGNPLLDPVERARPQSPMGDVASLLQSIVHVGAVVVRRRRPDRADDVERFTTAAAAAALAAYSAAHPIDERLLRAFRVAQELHEYAYSIHHLPHWRYVADAALPRLLGLN